MMQRRIRSALALAAAAFALGACSDSSSPGSGTLVLKLTDAPFPTDSVASVDVFVVRIDARAEAVASDDDANASLDDMDGSGWRTIATPNRVFDLLTLQNGVVANLGEATLPNGEYRGFRLILDTDQSSVTLKDGTVFTGTSDPGVHWPSAGQSGIKINLDRPVSIDSDTTEMLIDFDVEQSFVMRGSSLALDGLNFTPVIKATVQE